MNTKELPDARRSQREENGVREEKGKKNQSERGKKKKVTETASRATTGTTGSGGCIGLLINGEGCNTGLIACAFKDLRNEKPSLNFCTSFKNNMQKVRAPDFVKLTHAPDNFICAAKVVVPEFNRTMIITQVPDVSTPVNIEDFWRMIFQEEVHSVVLAIIPLECSVTLQQMFPILSGTFANHGKMFLNNKKVDSTVAMTAYTLEILPDECSNSLFTTVYHLHNWKQKRGLDNVGDLVSTVEKVLKTNENTVMMSMSGMGRAGTMLALFTSMLHV
ncbi:Protein CBG13306 [Caenorhabditis briggsae]|uniref:Protein CBG13306 n=1 Tax=Caenorhabditis briggsae TaxID=6238 RepID=A8XHJ1_CAEBR|nr:Protein CBG13306 [Caenorhabditis briggsae]CAP32115.2 Protein CBG13306 [Caenorhabditis briggsae]